MYLYRSWFYFGVSGGSYGKLMKVNIMNLNRQGKLYSQGHVPLVRTSHGKAKWDRLRERTTYEVMCVILFCLNVVCVCIYVSGTAFLVTVPHIWNSRPDDIVSASHCHLSAGYLKHFSAGDHFVTWCSACLICFSYVLTLWPL